MNHSPVATDAPRLRARPIWFTGSNTTVAPPARASSAVRSVELLSHTTSSTSQPSRVKPAVAARMLANVAAMSFSSLKAGTITEIFIAASVGAASAKSQPRPAPPRMSRRFRATTDGNL